MTGEELLNAVQAKGISIDYGGLTQESIDGYWNYQASLYESADAYLQGIGLTMGGTVTIEYNSVGDMVVSDVPSIPYSGPASFNLGGKTLSISERVEILYSSAWNWPCVAGCAYIWDITVVGAEDGEDQTVTGIGARAYSDTFFNYRVPDDDYAKTKGEYYLSVKETGEIMFHKRCECERRYTKHLGYGTEGYETVYSSNYNSWDTKGIYSTGILIDLESIETGFITLSWSSGGGGGSQTTLVFTATAGLSGRHCDPMNGDTDANHPITRSEVPAYGSGGYGGHGGGGGAGASTVVIYKFDTGKADSVEQIAIAKRHGYGSGGGAGGRGGDGCILIFW